MTDGTRKKPRTFSLTTGLLNRFDAVITSKNIDPKEHNELAEFLLDYALLAVENGTLKLPLEHVAVFKREE